MQARRTQRRERTDEELQQFMDASSGMFSAMRPHADGVKALSGRGPALRRCAAVVAGQWALWGQAERLSDARVPMFASTL